ncbi:type I-E CRISPR-associated protein Cse2/CasB [Streptomyces sp. NPDC020965]|uniref:type I-E CRISPR-associated protein Cse2/CasB n=1 Tax=Streptomyces sp. NPDC020965 TaxID=3365105 RepID=UPI0037BB4CB3
MTTTQQPSTDGYGREPMPPGLATIRCVKRLQYPYRNDSPAAVAVLARLRRSAGRPVHESPDSWGIDGLEDLATVRETAPVRRKDVGRDLAEENAVHLAVTLWALHQQSVHDANMHEFGHGLGRAVRRLATAKSDPGATAPDGQKAQPNAELSETLRKRFVRIGTSTSYESLAVRLREMTVLLRAARIPLDYGLLADQLFQWQDESRRAEIRRAWGRDFHFSHRTTRPRSPEAPADTDLSGA